MKKGLKFIDKMSLWAGNSVQWLAAILVLVMTFEVFMRYVFNEPTIWSYETSMMLGGVIFALAWSYVHKNRAHIRVDVIYASLPQRTQLIIEVIGTLILFFPLVLVLTRTSIVWAMDAWLKNEKMMESIWYPPSGPFRSCIALGYILLLLQGFSNFIRDFYQLIRNRSYD